MRLIFMGTPEFASPSLKNLHDKGYDVAAVFTQPDRPKGRGQQLQPPPVKLLAQQLEIPVMQPLKVRTPEIIQHIRDIQPDLIVVVAYGQILPQSLLDIPSFGCINVHASLLPKYRGAAPINWCLINGEKETGITTMQMSAGLDTGDILLKRKIIIKEYETAQELHDRLMYVGAELLIETIADLQSNTLKPEKQDDSESCYAQMLKKEMGNINWKASSVAISNLSRGLTPWPGTYTYLDNLMLKLYSVTLSDNTGNPGEIISLCKSGIEVACGEGSVFISEVQPEGKKRMSVAQFLSGNSITVGMRFSDVRKSN